MKINNHEFLKYLKENSLTNMNHIESIRFNKKSISVTIYNVNFFLNDFYNKRMLYNDLIFYLDKYLSENESEYISNKYYLKSKFQKLNIKNLND